ASTGPKGAKRRPSPSAFSSVRLAMEIDAGCSCSSGSTTPRAAPPAPIRSTRFPRISKPSRSRISCTIPAPSVLSPRMVAPSNFGRVDRPGVLRALGALRGKRERLELEGHRHVHALAAARAECGDRLVKAVARREDRLVGQVLAELPREGAVDLRRLRLGDRV